MSSEIAELDFFKIIIANGKVTTTINPSKKKEFMKYIALLDKYDDTEEPKVDTTLTTDFPIVDVDNKTLSSNIKVKNEDSDDTKQSEEVEVKNQDGDEPYGDTKTKMKCGICSAVVLKKCLQKHKSSNKCLALRASKRQIDK